MKSHTAKQCTSVKARTCARVEMARQSAWSTMRARVGASRASISATRARSPVCST